MTNNAYVAYAEKTMRLGGSNFPQYHIGYFAIGDSADVVEEVIKHRRAKTEEKAQWAYKKKGTEKGLKIQQHEQILPYTRYIQTVNDANRLRKEIAVAEQQIDIGGPIPTRLGRPLDDDATARIFAMKTGIDLKKVWREEDKLNEKRAKLYSATSAEVLQLAREYNPDFHTPDHEGHMRYVATKDPKITAIIEEEHPALLSENARKKHTYITGGSGSGKSELLKVLVHGYLDNPNSSVVVIDPHGDLVRQIARMDDFGRSDRLVYIDPFLIPHHMPTMNPLEIPEDTLPQDREVIAQQLVNVFEQLLKGSSGTDLTVNMRTLLMPCILTLLNRPNSTLVDLQRFMDDNRNTDLVDMGKQSPRAAISRFFQYDFVNDGTLNRSKASIAKKLQSLFNTMTFDELVNGRTTFNLEQAISEKKIVLFNLAKGRLGNDASEAFGRFIVAALQGIAMRRENVPESERIPIHLFIDECQNYISPATVNILEETRKYGLHMTLAQQVAGRGMTPEIRTVVLNNTNVKFAGRTPEDARMAKLLDRELSDIQNLGTGEFLAKIGNGNTFLLKGRQDLLGNDRALSKDDWLETIVRMVPYYRQITDIGIGNTPPPTKTRKLI